MSPVLAFGDDRSDAAERCWDWIAAHRWAGWDLEVVTALPPEAMQPVPEERARLHPWAPEAPRDGDALGFDSVEHLLAEVDPRVALIERDWDLVAVGPRGTGLLKSLHLGSTADWLLREPTSPLVIARSPGPVHTVLVADDGSSHAARAIDTLAKLPWLGDVKIRVIVVGDGRIDSGDVASTAPSRFGSRPADVEVVVREGDPKETIIGEVEHGRPDLVVMGARGIGGMRRLILGSSTAAVASSTDRSLLVAHAAEADPA